MQFSVVLVRPQFSGNLGAVARAMKNMGFADLRMVEPEVTAKDREARMMAAHATDVLDQSRSFSDLEAALQGFDMVAGTSRRRGKDRMKALTPRAFAEFCATRPKESRVALLFGTEDTGLTAGDLKYCQRIISIPSHPAFPSLNLAQAVMVLCYELFSVSETLLNPDTTNGKIAEEGGLAKAENLEGMFVDLESILGESGFLDKHNPEHLMRLLRNLFNRALPTEKEVRIIRGICRQLRWWAGHGNR